MVRIQTPRNVRAIYSHQIFWGYVTYFSRLSGYFSVSLYATVQQIVGVPLCCCIRVLSIEDIDSREDISCSVERSGKIYYRCCCKKKYTCVYMLRKHLDILGNETVGESGSHENASADVPVRDLFDNLKN